MNRTGGLSSFSVLKARSFVKGGACRQLMTVPEIYPLIRFELLHRFHLNFSILLKEAMVSYERIKNIIAGQGGLALKYSRVKGLEKENAP